MDCLLGVGGPDGDAIAEIFQLSGAQREKLQGWGAELKQRNKLLRERAEVLMERNRRVNPDELLKVSIAYKAILDSMERNVVIMDSRMLALFNERQYERYRLLCQELSLRPIPINRSIDER